MAKASKQAWEVAYWMPLPSGIPPIRTPGLATQLPPAPKADEELDDLRI